MVENLFEKSKRRGILASVSSRAPAARSLSRDEVSFCDPLAWLSELYKDRQYIKTSILTLANLVKN